MKKILLAALLYLVSINIDAQVILGVNGHPLTSVDYKGISYSEQFKLISDNKFTSYRIDMILDNNNNIINRNGSFIEFLSLAKQNKISIVPNIHYNTLNFGDSYSSAYKKGYAFGQIFVNKYGSLFNIIELGNEVNYSIPGRESKYDSMYHNTYDARMMVLINYLKGACTAIKNINSKISIIIGVAGNDIRFVKKLKENNLLFDILGNTRYGSDDTFVPELNKSLQNMNSIINKNIWLLEVNYSDGTKNVSNIIVKNWLDKAIKGVMVNDFVKAIYVYELLDENSNIKSHPTQVNYGVYKLNNNIFIPKFGNMFSK